MLDMSQLTPEEAIHEARTAASTTCVSYAFAEDGRLVFRAARLAGGTVLLGVAAFLAACGSPEGGSPESRAESAGSTLFDPADSDALSASSSEERAANHTERRLGEAAWQAPQKSPHSPAPLPPDPRVLEPSPGWPSAVESSAPKGAHAVLPREPLPPHRVSPPQERTPWRTAGKPVSHLAGGLAPRKIDAL